MPIDWEALRLAYWGIKATGAAIRIGEWFVDRLGETNKEQQPALVSDAVSKITRERLTAMESPLPTELQRIPLVTLSIFEAIKRQADKIYDELNDVITGRGFAPANKRDRIF